MARQLVYLFSSNRRPLYVQDILDVLAAPPGARYEFRYDKRYVDPDALERSLDGLEALVHFSLQQEAEYHAPAFIPVRRASVVDTRISAGIFVCTFAVTGYVALAKDEAEPLSAPIRRYAEALERSAVKRPYGPSASVGADLRDVASEIFDESADQSVAFRHTTELLQQTEWFRSARFVRVTGLREGPTKGASLAMSDGRYVLTAGKTYELELTHYEPADVTDRQSFTVTSDDDIVQLIGTPGFDIASKYDYIRLYLHASLPPRDEPRETIVAIAPAIGVQGPTVRIPMKVSAPPGRTAALTAASVAILLVFGLPAVLTGMSQGLKLLLVIIGALGVSLLQSYGLSLSIPSGLGFTSPKTSSEADTPQT